MKEEFLLRNIYSYLIDDDDDTNNDNKNNNNNNKKKNLNCLNRNNFLILVGTNCLA